jgi:hypothetical protein
MQKFYRAKSFHELKAHWDNVLKEDGFKDIEKEIAGTTVLKTCSMSVFYRRGEKNIEITELVKENRTIYYQILTESIAKEQHFDDESDRLIMERTAEGFKISDISLELKSLGRTKFNRDTIRYIRRRYEHRWKIRQWSQMDMVSRKKKLPIP